MKTCKKCNLEKPMDDFSPDRRNRDGRYARCKSCNRQYAKDRRENNPAYREYAEAYYQKNKERMLAVTKKNYQKNKAAHFARNREHYHKVLKHRPDFKANCAHRKVLSRFLARYGGEKSGRTHEVLGYSVAELKEHISRQFTKGMSWENYGDWHIDHITSVSTFVKRGEKDPAVVNALANLRPMWAEENQKKRDKIYYLI